MLGKVAHALTPSTGETEAEVDGPIYTASSGQPGPHKDTLSKNETKQNKTERPEISK